jgi:hypothetical protein
MTISVRGIGVLMAWNSQSTQKADEGQGHLSAATSVVA